MIRFHAWLIPALVTTGLVVDVSSRFAFPTPTRIDDGQIVAALDRMHTAELECSLLALEHATMPAVKAMARRLRDEHAAARAANRELTERLRIPISPRPPAAVADSHPALMADLRAMKTPDFDRAYIEHTIGFHTSVLDDLENVWLPAATSSEVKALLTRTVPMLKAHLELVKNMKQQLPRA
jgi:predicted outer membrane protein